MSTALVIGSGPAAAGVVLALSRRDDLRITVIDIGVRLEKSQQYLVDRLASSDPREWSPATVARVSEPPVESGTPGVPEKRAFGSDFPFRNVGQLDGLTAADSVTTSLISAAFGGFSNVWGSQVMPFTDSAFETWPIDAGTFRPHYEAVLNEIPFAGEEDDLAAAFPLIGGATALPELSARSQLVLDAYHRNRTALNGRGITMGKARLAFDAARCCRCGLCMTGCPYGLIYSAAHTLDALRCTRRVEHHSGLLAVEVTEHGAKAQVVAVEIATGQRRRFEADRVYVACGAMGTTRLVASSLGLFDLDCSMLESQQFVLPMLSRRATPDPRGEPDFTLNQFNMVVALDGGATDISQLHFYTFNAAFVRALPRWLQSAEQAQVQLLRRLTVALGYLPSWWSPRLRIRVRASSNAVGVHNVRVSRDRAPPHRNGVLAGLLAKLGRSGRALDLYPVLPMVRLAAGGKSYHWGGSFPHARDRSTVFSSDRLGRVGPWQRIHLVDASVFPSIPAMTFTLTIMANAHRIASETLELAS